MLDRRATYGNWKWYCDQNFHVNRVEYISVPPFSFRSQIIFQFSRDISKARYGWLYYNISYRYYPYDNEIVFSKSFWLSEYGLWRRNTLKKDFKEKTAMMPTWGLNGVNI